ncbi:MAG: hypothetical protein ACRDIB_13850, partial [Ardenticatenaceae bacterium]
ALLRGEDYSFNQIYLPASIHTSTLSNDPPVEEQIIKLAGNTVDAGETKIVEMEVESGAQSLAVSAFVNSEMLEASLMSPDGTTYPGELGPPTGEGFFGDAWTLSMEVADPPAGQWELHLSAQEDSAFLLLASVETTLGVQLAGWEDTPLHAGEPWRLQAGLTSPVAGAAIEQVEIQLSRAERRPSRPGASQEVARGTARGRSLEIRALPEPGIYSVVVTVTGRQGDRPFERVFFRSIRVVDGPGSSSSS